jgi:hypothetical protein
MFEPDIECGPPLADGRNKWAWSCACTNPKPAGSRPSKLKQLDGLVEPFPVLERAGPGLGPLDESTVFLLFRRSPLYRFSTGPTSSAQTAVPKHPSRQRIAHPVLNPQKNNPPPWPKFFPPSALGNTIVSSSKGWRLLEKRKFIDGPFPNLSSSVVGALLLVPEIGLTPQMEDRLRGWFGDALAIWHSDMSDGRTLARVETCPRRESPA